MKFSYSWIREMVDGLDVPAESLERLITMKTAECEGIETTGELLAGAIPARVEAVEQIEGGKHVVKAIVDAGKYGRKTVVCGAPNCRAGITTVYVPLGSKTIAGVLSEGMLASASELGIGRDHAGIIELAPSDELPPPDHVIDIDNKSITHRPDLWGHHGMAREVAAITGKTFRDPVNLGLLPALGSPIKVEIEDLTLCPRYSALVFENVTVQPSPLWLQHRLTSVGLNPINNIVDLTNYIMAELAQPMHAFDRQKLHGDTIYVRSASDSDSIVALDDVDYSTRGFPYTVIADASGPIAIAGVIGGKGSAISATTTSIVLESANFNAASVRKTSVALKLRTDASMRFEKSQDPHNTVRALARALELLPLLSPGIRLVGGLADHHAAFTSPAPIDLDLDWLARKLGRVLDATEVRRILESLHFGVELSGSGVFSVTIPSWRATKDVALPEDLVEEVGRMIGYDSIPPQPPLVPCAPSFDPPEREFLRGIRRLMAARGYTEVSNYSFISEESARRFGLPIEGHVRVLNPIAAGQELMRTSLLPGIHANIVENAKHFDDFRMFEIGQEIHTSSTSEDRTTTVEFTSTSQGTAPTSRSFEIPAATPQPGKPVERPHLMAAIYSKDAPETLLELKRAAESLAPGLRVLQGEPNSWEHPARCAELWWQGRAVGRLSELHPSLIDGGRAAILDLELDLLQELKPERGTYKPVRRFPTSAFDLSVIADARELAGNLELRVRQFAGDLTETVEYVREFQGAPLREGRKSVTFRITAGSPDRTLSSVEITDLYNRIVAGLSELGYEFRG
jgi:phenylalanyl-tRNA synthetase beta chain